MPLACLSGRSLGYCPGRVRIHFTPLCQCISEETLKAIGPFYLVSMAMGSKISHQSSLECVNTTHSKLCPPEVWLCSRKRCFALVSEEDRITCPSGTWSFISKAIVQPPAVVGATFWLAEWFYPNMGLRSRSSRLGNRKAQSIATEFCPNPVSRARSSPVPGVVAYFRHGYGAVQ